MVARIALAALIASASAFAPTQAQVTTAWDPGTGTLTVTGTANSEDATLGCDGAGTLTLDGLAVTDAPQCSELNVLTASFFAGADNLTLDPSFQAPNLGEGTLDMGPDRDLITLAPDGATGATATFGGTLDVEGGPGVTGISAYNGDWTLQQRAGISGDSFISAYAPASVEAVLTGTDAYDLYSCQYTGIALIVRNQISGTGGAVEFGTNFGEDGSMAVTFHALGGDDSFSDTGCGFFYPETRNVAFTYDGGPGDDTVQLNGTNDDDLIEIGARADDAATDVALRAVVGGIGQAWRSLIEVETLNLSMLDGDDVIRGLPAAVLNTPLGPTVVNLDPGPAPTRFSQEMTGTEGVFAGWIVSWFWNDTVYDLAMPQSLSNEVRIEAPATADVRIAPPPSDSPGDLPEVAVEFIGGEKGVIRGSGTEPPQIEVAFEGGATVALNNQIPIRWHLGFKADPSVPGSAPSDVELQCGPDFSNLSEGILEIDSAPSLSEIPFRLYFFTESDCSYLDTRINVVVQGTILNMSDHSPTESRHSSSPPHQSPVHGEDTDTVQITFPRIATFDSLLVTLRDSVDYFQTVPLESTVQVVDGADQVLAGGGMGADTFVVCTDGVAFTDDGMTITAEGFEPIHYTNFEVVEVNSDACAMGTATESPPQPHVALLDVYPNPASEQLEVAVILEEPRHLRLALFDILGREVARLHDGTFAAGVTTRTADLRGLSPGVYLVRVSGEAFAATRRVTVVR